MLVPCTKRTRLNQAASGNGAITILFMLDALAAPCLSRNG
jgi:hypothetical protein